MTSLYSGGNYSFENRRNARRHSRRAATKPNAKSIRQQLPVRPRKVNPIARDQDIQCLECAPANQLSTSDNALREKRRWVQRELEAGRLNGKAARQLHDLLSRRNMGKLDHQRALAQDLSVAAKEALQLLEEVFEGMARPRSTAGATSPSLGGGADETIEAPADNRSLDNANRAYTAAENDAIATQKLLKLGIPLADHGATALGNAEGTRIKRE